MRIWPSDPIASRALRSRLVTTLCNCSRSTTTLGSGCSSFTTSTPGISFRFLKVSTTSWFKSDSMGFNSSLFRRMLRRLI